MNKVLYPVAAMTDLSTTLAASTATQVFTSVPVGATRAIVTFTTDVQVSFADNTNLDCTASDGAHFYAAGTYVFEGRDTSFPKILACPTGGIAGIAHVTYAG